MVAVVNGSGLGLFTSRGANGSANLGQSREQVYVNSTTGNLVIQHLDEFLTATGRDLGITRTYNSLGQIDGDNNDGWRMGVYRSLVITPGTSIVKTFGDGAQVTYLFNGGTEYVSTEGDGAHDKINLVGGQWVWTDGSERNTETYDSGGKLLNSKDADGNTFSFTYGTGVQSTLIVQVTTVSPAIEGGDSSVTNIFLDYLAGTKNLEKIRVVRNGVTESLTSYGYDGQGRLSTVTLDLTPGSALTVADSYVTTYTYDAASGRVSSITQKAAGSANVTASVSFTYVSQNGEYRLKTYTDGEGHVTTLTYTDVSASGGSSTTLPANGAVLSTTETQNVPNNYALNGSAVSTSDTQTTNTNYNVNNSQITSGATQTDTYNRNNGALSTSDSQTTTNSYNVINAQITTGATQTDNYNRNDAALSTTDTQSTTNNYNLNSGLLTTPTGGGWGPASALEAEPAGSTASVPQMAFDSSGNGFATWVVTGSSPTSYTLKAARYTRSTNTWAAPTSLYTSSTNLPQVSMAVDAGGNAIVAWLAGAQISVARYTGSWSAASVVVSSGATLKPTVAIKGSFAALIWGEGSAAGRNAFASRWNGTSWSTKAAVDSQSNPVDELAVAVDNLGHVIVAFSQRQGSFAETCVWTNQLLAGSSTWTGAVSRDTLSPNAISPQIVLDANGNGFLSFAQGAETAVIRYTRAGNTWEGSPTFVDNQSGIVSQTSLATDAAGNAVLGWVQADSGGFISAYAAVYSASNDTWGPAKLLESLNTNVTAGSLKTSISGAFASAAWVQSDGTNSNAYAATFNGLYWSTANVIESSTNAASAPTLAVDSLGNASAIWIQSNGTSPSVFVNRFVAGGSTAPAGGSWSTETALGDGGWYGMVTSTIGYANNGDAVAAWIQGPSVYTRRYIAATNIWQPAVMRSAPGTTVWDAVALRVAVDPVTGSAAIGWIQAVDDEDSMFMSYMSAAGNWSAATSVESSSGEVGIYEDYFGVSVAGTYAAVSFGQQSNGVTDIFLARMNNGALLATALVENSANVADFPRVAIDSSGNASVVWQQQVAPGDAVRSYQNRWNATTQSFSGAQLLDTDVDGSANPQIAFDAQGNGIAIFNQTGGLFARRFNATTGAWGTAISLQSLPNNPSGFRLAVDSAGNAIVGWMQNDATNITSAYVNRFTASTGTWSGSTLIESSAQTLDGDEYVAVAINGDKAVAAWQQANGALWDLYTARFSGGVWTTPQLMESQEDWSSSWHVGIDTAGRIGLTWLQPTDETGYLPWFKRFDISSASSYTVPAGATWQSLANTLYGINSAAAGAALQTAMGNPALSTGAQLSGWPTTLTVTSSTTVTVPAYYNVPAGATWQSIANAVYGINSAAAGSALQSAMANPALSTGLHLTGFPSTLSVTATLAPHYAVPAGASWQSIANALYGLNSAAAGTALQTALGNPSIASGARLYNIPATLAVTTTTTVTVPPYYTIQTGATWQSIANAIYGINSAAAGSALQSAMGNPALTAGNRLTNLPATISIITSLAPHYLVPSGATWQAVANTLYGVNSAAAGTALQTALGNPALTAGARLYGIPATLTVTTTSTVTVPAYFVIPASPGWQAIANTLYGINSAAAGNALQTALGSPALTPGNRLTSLPSTLTVVTQQSVTVAPYYIVPAGATWTSITQAIYNPVAADLPAAAAALQAATGNPTLTTSLHLTVPANLTYSTATSTPVSRLPTWIVTQDTVVDHHADAMSATLNTTHDVTTPTHFGVIPSQFQTTRVQDWPRDYGPIAALPTTESQQRDFNLNTNLLTNPPSGWFVAQTVSGSLGDLSPPVVKFDGAGNGLAVWRSGTGLRWMKYSAATKSWGAVQAQINTGTPIIGNFTLAMDPAGNAVVGWVQGHMGNMADPAATVYASVFNTSTGLWGPATSIGSANRDFNISAAIRGGVAAISYTTSTVLVSVNNNTNTYRVHVATYSGGSWVAGQNISGAGLTAGTIKSAVGVDSTGTINVVWTEGTLASATTVSRRFSGTWQAPQTVTSWGAPSSNFETMGSFNAAGDGMITVSNLVWKYVKATNTWTQQTVTSGSVQPRIELDDTGRAALGYQLGATAYVTNYNGSTWDSPFIVSTNAAVNSLFVSTRNGKTVATWDEVSGSVTTQYSRANDGSGWGASFAAGTGAGRGVVGVDSTGDMHVLWDKGTTSSWEVMTNRFVPVANAPGYIVLDSTPNWQEVAALLYGQNRPEAAAALAAAMPTATLSPNAQLAGFPSFIRFTANFDVPPYYLIPNGWSMQQVAQALYGSGVPSPQAGQALQALINAGTVTQVGNKLTNLPQNLNVTAPEPRPAAAYYVVTSSSWQDIAAVLYGINSVAAGQQLQTRMGGASAPLVNSELLLSNLPSELLLDITTTQSTTPYFRVPSPASWQDVTLALYGTNVPEAVAALQAAMAALSPPVNVLTPGGELRGMPATLNYDTTHLANVTPYYLVVGGDTWALIAQKVYGTSDPAAATELQRVMQLATPGITLNAGVHLLVPTSISYVATLGLATVYQQTDVTDALGLMTTYKANVQGQLIATLSPTVNGARIETRYDYDLKGNITSVTLDPGGLNRVTAMTYDDNGNLTGSRDAAGNTVTRVYDLITNQLSSETTYLVPDPDGFGGQSAQSPLTSRYLYDSENHLRFSISADGRVVEHNYYLAGTRKYTRVFGGTAYSGAYTLAALTTWAANRTPVELAEYTYDPLGNLDTAKRYESTDANGNGTGAVSTTKYVYDQRGNLVNVIDARGTGTSDVNDFKTTYVYDGLNRVKQKVEWLSSSDTRTTFNSFEDQNRQVVTTINSTLQPLGRVTTTVYDRSGAVLTTSNADTSGTSFGSTQFAYDIDNRLRMITDPMGVRSYVLYDTVDRKVGEVDAEGRLTRFVYNRAGQVIKSVRYSNALSSTALATLVSAGVPANVTVDSLLATLTLDSTKDQTTRLVYDKAGRLVYSIDAAGYVTQNFYDGASRVTDAVSYATAVAIAAGVDELDAGSLNISTSANDRHVRNFYNSDGMLIGTLDSAGYLVEFIYDSFGHLQRQIGYANVTAAADRLAGSLTTLRATADDDPAHDVNSYFYYDAQGRRTGVLDAEGYFTETKYDLAGNVAQQIRYEVATTYNASLAAVRAAATGTKNQVTTNVYDGANRLVSQTNYEGTLSAIAYNPFDEAISATVADRTTQKRYNAMGWVTEELSGEGSAQITGGMTQAQINAIWAQWSIKHTYDNGGRRKSTTNQYGNASWFYYDVDGRVRYTVRDQGNGTGEVAEAKYNALGQQTDTIAYSARISMTSIAGGLVDSAISNAVAAIANISSDAHSYLTYKLTGAVASQRNQEGAQSDFTYDAFGAVTNKLEKMTSSLSVEHQYGYDKRGLLTNTAWDPTGINRTETRAYDAFGRLLSVTDQYGRRTSSDYDRLGRVVATHAGLAGEDARFEYDSFGRVLKFYDAFNQLTTYAYDDGLKRAVMTTPEGITVTTVHTATGETVSVIDSDGRGPTYEYNKNGQVTRVSDGGGTIETRTYDRAGRQDTAGEGRQDSSGSGRNIVTRFGYDPASRLLTRTVDDGVLNLQTAYQYDGQGRVTRVTEASGRVTDTSYYTDGRIKQIAIDPAALNLRTYFEYDLAGNNVKKTEGYGSTQARVTSYLFDKLGRRYEEITDPTTLNLRTQYKFDINGNVTRRIDANGYSTWYIYDADNRLQYTVDALGNVAKQTYDLNGRVIASTSYATPVSVASFGDIVTSVSPTTSANDHIERTVFDRNGRAIYQIDAIGIVTERSLDASGNVTRELTYSRAIPVSGTYATPASVATALGVAGNTAGTPAANDHVTWMVYDSRGRAAFVVDVNGGVVRNTYDTANNVLEARAYATIYSGAKTLAALNTWAAGTAVDTQALNRVTRHRYDNAGREQYTIDAVGGVTEYTYDGIGNVTRTLRYYKAIPAIGTYDTFTQIAQALNTAGNVAGSTGITDRAQWAAYDAAGRTEFTLDSLNGVNGAVRRVTYDSVGNVVLTQAFKATRLLTLPSDIVSLRSWASSNSDSSATGDHFTAFWYDGAGRQRFQLDAQGYLNETRYNDANNSVSNIAYAVSAATHGLTTASTYAQTVAAAAVAANNVGAHVVTIWRDAAGRERFMLDAERYLTEKRYNDVTLQQTNYVFGLQLAPSRLTTASTLTDAANAAASSDIAGSVGTANTVSNYDAAGRLLRVTYSFDGSYEEYGYDAFDNKTSYRNQKGSIWNYTYDALSHLLDERSPQVSITSIGSDASFTVDTSTASIVTRMTYDAFGNVLTRAEGIRRFTDNTENATGSRVTTYGYDTLNRQVTVTYPTVKVYAAPANDEQNTTPASMLQVADYTPITTTTYDALGNAVLNVDVAGAYSHKAYDNLGRAKYEVDALKNVTEYVYDAFNNKTATVRYATPMGTSGLVDTAVWSASEIQTRIVSGADDRGIAVTYDRRNQQVSVLQSATFVFTTAAGVAGGVTDTAGAETKYVYNAFGDVTVQSVLLERATNKYADTYFFYDSKGQITATVDPKGHLTTRSYDVRGNVTKVYEYARPLTGSPPWNVAAGVPTPTGSPDADLGYDHETINVYDLLSRLTSQSISNVQYASISGQTVINSVGSQLTTFGYDAVGNRTRVTDQLGASTYTYYDVLGRVIAVAEPVRDVDGTSTTRNIIPITVLDRDVYGNVTRDTRYGGDGAGATEASYTLPATNVLSQVRKHELDNYGHEVRTLDAMNFVSYASYDKRGNVSKEWRAVTNADGAIETQVQIHKYDALGREVALIQPLVRSDTQTTSVTSKIISAATLTEISGASPEWAGENNVWVGWPGTSTGTFRVIVDYTKRSRNQGNGSTTSITLNVSSTNDAWVKWTDPQTAAEGGILTVNSVNVYSVGPNGELTAVTGGGAVGYSQISYTQNVYNAFGEVAKRGVNTSLQDVNGTYQEHWTYDVAGRVLRTNADDGVEKVYLYDVAGRTTGEIRSQSLDLTAYSASAAAALNNTQSMRTEIAYDVLDHVVEQRAPSYVAASGSTVSPTVKQKIDRWGNKYEMTDAANQVTKYRFSVLGGLLEIQLPTVSVLDTRTPNVVPAAVSAVTYQRNHYDILGRAIGATDANGNVNSVTLNIAGQALTENHADAGVKTLVTDALGRQVRVIDEMDAWTQYTYDLGDRLTAVDTEYNRTGSPGNWTHLYLTRSYGYDEAGRRTSETSGEGSSLGGPERTKYFYDLTEHVIRRRSAMGFDTRYGWDVRGNKLREQDALGGAMSWSYDFWGRIQSHTDLGGAITSYSYTNKAGLLTSQGSTAGQNQAFAYNAAGMLTTINDTAVSRTTTYGYDAAGRRSRETTVINGRQHQDSTITFDALGRMSGIADLRYSLTYQYDAQGNRTRTFATYKDPVQATKTQELWYTYDTMNRVKLSQGKLVGNQLTYDQSQGLLISYYVNGRRMSVAQYSGDMLVKQDLTDSNGIRNITYTSMFGSYTETYGYDFAGRLTSIGRTGELRTGTVGTPPTISFLPQDTVISRQYDNASRMTREDNWRVGTNTTMFVYDDDGRLIKQTAYDLGNISGIRTNETVFNYDGAGVLRGYNTSGFDRPAGIEHLKYTSYYSNSYLSADSYLLTQQSARTTFESGAPALSGLSKRNYNVNRELSSTEDTKEAGNNRYFLNNANGEAMTVVRGNYATPAAVDTAVFQAFTATTNAAKSAFFFFANGKTTGSVGQLLGEDPFNSTVVAHFDVNYTSADQQVAPTSVSEVVAREGETLRQIALRVLGDGNLWYLIADENGLTDPDAALAAGRILRMPNTVVSISNSSNSFKPFNPGDAIGDTTPTQVGPPPPKGGGCGVLGMIIMIVVLIVVTIFTVGTLTYPTLTGFMAIMSAGAGAIGSASIGIAMAAAAAGSIASQGVGMLMGMQKGFDWKGFAISVVSAGVTAGLGSAASSAAQAAKTAAETGEKLGKLASAANLLNKIGGVGRAVVANALTQGISVATGLQDRFSWREVAITAVAKPITSAIGNLAGAISAPLGDTASGMISDFSAGVAGSLVRRAMGGKVDTQTMLADAFGNALGNRLASGSRPNAYAGLKLGERIKASVSGFTKEMFGSKTKDGIDAVPTTSSAGAAAASSGKASDSGTAIANDEDQPLQEIVVTGYRNGRASEVRDSSPMLVQHRWWSREAGDSTDVSRSYVYRPGSGGVMQALASQRIKGGTEFYFPNGTAFRDENGATTFTPGLPGTGLNLKEGIFDELVARRQHLVGSGVLDASYVAEEVAAIDAYGEKVWNDVRSSNSETIDAVRASDAPAYLNGSEGARARLNAVIGYFDPTFKGLPDTPDQQLASFVMNSAALTAAMITGGASSTYLASRGFGFLYSTAASSVAADGAYQLTERGYNEAFGDRYGRADVNFLELGLSAPAGVAFGWAAGKLSDAVGMGSLSTRPSGLDISDVFPETQVAAAPALDPQAALAAFRARSLLTADDTLAMAVIDGRPFFGVNSSASPASLGLRRQTLEAMKAQGIFPADKTLGGVQALSHAEAHALMRAEARLGSLEGKNAQIYVDRYTCNFCFGTNGLPKLAPFYGINQTTVISPGRIFTIPDPK